MLQFPWRFWDAKVKGSDFFGHVPENAGERGMFAVFYDMALKVRIASSMHLTVIIALSIPFQDTIALSNPFQVVIALSIPLQSSQMLHYFAPL